MNVLSKNRVREKPTKSSYPIVQGNVKNQLEVVEVESVSLGPHIWSLYYALHVEYPRLK